MKIFKKVGVAFFLLISAHSQGARAGVDRCFQLFQSHEIIAGQSHHSEAQLPLNEKRLAESLSRKIGQVLEFQYIRTLAEKKGIRVWLFGGSAASFLHYVKWDLELSLGGAQYQKERFDYDFTNIFRSTQDIDLVVDATPEEAIEFQIEIAQRFPHFLGDRASKWEVRPLRHRVKVPGQSGYKEALLDDFDFKNQNTDSNSIGMVELTIHETDPVVRDLRNWDSKNSLFLKDAIRHQISFLRSPAHFETARAKAGENPEILSVLRILVKAFQYDLEIPKPDFEVIRQISESFSSEQIQNPIAIRRIQDISSKLIIHATDLERAIDQLDGLGLREKLIKMGNPKEVFSFAWWLNREPLRSKPLGEGKGPTAQDLELSEVYHEASNHFAMESIMRSPLGEPNVLISRQDVIGERALYGEGFYTSKQKTAYRGTKIYVRFSVDPRAREGSDFIFNTRDIIIFKNKKALKVIPESLFINLKEIVQIVDTDQWYLLKDSDQGLLEKNLRRFNAARVLIELQQLLHSKSKDQLEEFVTVFDSFRNPKVVKILTSTVCKSVSKSIYQDLVEMAHSGAESEVIRSIQITERIAKTLDSMGALKVSEFLSSLKIMLQSTDSSFDFRFKLLRLIQASHHFRGQVQLSSLLGSFSFQERIKIVDKFLNHSRDRSLIQNNRDDLLNLMILVRSNRRMRKELMHLYEDPKELVPRQMIQAILDAPDISDEKAVGLIHQLVRVQDLKENLGVFEIDELFQLKSMLEGTSLEEKTVESILDLYEPTYLNSEWTLGRALSQWFHSQEPSVANRGEKLLKMEGFLESPVVRAYQKILDQQKARSHSLSFSETAREWIASGRVPVGLKFAFLLSQFGTSRYESYRVLVPPKQSDQFQQRLMKHTHLDVFEYYFGGEALEGAKLESFLFRVFSFPKKGVTVKIGNPDRRSSDGTWWDEPEHEVVFSKPFQIQVTPVTQLQWSLVMGKNPSRFVSEDRKSLNRPVERVSWIDVKKFIDKLNELDSRYLYRLPTEAEWEYAARSGARSRYSFGDRPEDLDSYGWHAGNSGDETHEVASLKPNPGGLYDIHGNVAEWVDGTEKSVDSYRVVRGDHFQGSLEFGLRTTFRDMRSETTRDSRVGFRLVRTLRKGTK